MHSKSHYDTLHISRNAKPAAITEAYERLVQKCRQDLSPNADASRYLKAIGEAHAVLADPAQRAVYDLWLQEQELGKSALKQVATPVLAEVKSVTTDVASRQATQAPQPAVMPADNAGPTTNRSRIAFATGSAFLLAGVIGFFIYRSGSEAPHPASESDGMSSGLTAMDNSETAAALAPAAMSDSKTLPVTEIIIPEHDPVAIDRLLGPWRGSTDDSGHRRMLDVRRKSEDSFVFQLQSKSGNTLGEVYGVASFRDGYAIFANEEYACTMVFSIKSESLNVNTSGCQEYHGQGSGFDGSYSRPKPDAPRNTAQTPSGKPRQNSATIVASVDDAAPVTSPTPAAPAANPGKLYRFIATVKGADGKTQRIELVAANEEAARAILRDFRGNPTVVRIRRTWF